VEGAHGGWQKAWGRDANAMITLNPLNSSVHSFLVERVTGLLRACRLVRGMQECKCQPTSYWIAAHVRYSNASGGGEESACRHLTYLGYPTDATSYDVNI
jgi:hypothetical protein